MDNTDWSSILLRSFKIFSLLSTALPLPEDMRSSFQGLKQVLLPSCGTSCLIAAHRQCAQFVAYKVAGSNLPVELVDMIADFGSNRANCLHFATLTAQQGARGRILVNFSAARLAQLDEVYRLLEKNFPKEMADQTYLPSGLTV